MAESLIHLTSSDDCTCELERRFTTRSVFDDVPDPAGGWEQWREHLARLLAVVIPGPVHVAVISQAGTERYVQFLAGHGHARVEVSSDAYLEGDDILDPGAHPVLTALGFELPGAVELAGGSNRNWRAVLHDVRADELAELVADALAAVITFDPGSPVAIELFGADHPCARCAWGIGPICEQCGGALVPIVFGMPADELVDAAERGEVVLGGCGLPIEGEPRRSCPCGHLTAP